MTTYIKKIRAGLVPNASVDTYVGDPGTIFYNPAVGALYLSDGVNPGGTALVTAGGSGDRLVNGASSFRMLSDGTLTLTHPAEPALHPLSTVLTVQKAAGNYHTISGAYGLSLQATPVPSGYGLNTNTNFVDIFHDGISVNVDNNTWAFGTDGALTFPNGDLNIVGNTISNYVAGDDGGSGSQLEVSQSKTVITNGVTNSLGGGPSLTGQSLFEVSTNGILSSFQVINFSAEGNPTLTNEFLTELDNLSFKIGQRVTNDLGDGSEPLVAFNGWTFSTDAPGYTKTLTLPNNGTINDYVGSAGVLGILIDRTFQTPNNANSANFGVNTIKLVLSDVEAAEIVSYLTASIGVRVWFNQGNNYPITSCVQVSTGIWTVTATGMGNTFATFAASNTLIFIYTGATPNTYTNFPQYVPVGDGAGITISKGGNSWNFGTDGELTLPLGGVIADGSSGSGDGHAIILKPQGGSATQALKIYPTGGGDGDHVHLTAGQIGGTTELYLGDDFQYVKLVNDGNVQVRASTWGASPVSAAWTFGTNGDLILPTGGDIKNSSGASVLGGSPDGGLADNSAGLTITTYSLSATQYDTSGSVTYNIASAGASAAGIIIKGLTVNHTQVISGSFNQGSNTVNWNDYTISGTLWNQVASVTAFVTDSRGYTFLALVTDMWEVPHGPCLVEGTLITMADGTHRTIEDISHGELIRVWNFDLGEFSEAQPIWIKLAEETDMHDVYTFSDGTKLRTVGHHVFNKEAGAFTKFIEDTTPVGTTTFNEQGLEVILVSKERVVAPTRYYNIWTQYHLNLFANGILTSNRFNNIYPIVDMKFVKDDRALRSVDEFASIDEKYITGLRLQEQSEEYTAEYIADYVHNRLERLDIANQVEQGI